MNLNDSNQIRQYEEADRLLRQAKELTGRLDKSQPGSADREILERRLGHVEQRAVGHALLAHIRLPERTASFGETLAEALEEVQRNEP